MASPTAVPRQIGDKNGAKKPSGPSLSLALNSPPLDGATATQPIHPLKYTWDVFFSHRSGSQKANKKEEAKQNGTGGVQKEEWEEGVVKLGGFSSVSRAHVPTVELALTVPMTRTATDRIASPFPRPSRSTFGPPFLPPQLVCHLQPRFRRVGTSAGKRHLRLQHLPLIDRSRVGGRGQRRGRTVGFAIEKRRCRQGLGRGRVRSGR